MKTFDEALAQVIVAGKDQTKEAEAAMATIVETCHRYRELTTEASASSVVNMFITARLMNITAGQERPADVLMSMFCCGLICGVEMEKTEKGVEL